MTEQGRRECIAPAFSLHAQIEYRTCSVCAMARKENRAQILFHALTTFAFHHPGCRYICESPT